MKTTVLLSLSWLATRIGRGHWVFKVAIPDQSLPLQVPRVGHLVNAGMDLAGKGGS
jgi:hypothetical protein